MINVNPGVTSVFKQAVLLIATDVWIRECPREVRREDYYCYLKFDSEDACAEAVKGRQTQPVFSVERIIEPADVFQYKTPGGEPELYIRPRGTQSFYGMDCSDCADDKAAFAKLMNVMPDESQIMSSLCDEQDHVMISFSCSANYEKFFTIVLFRDGNAYYYENPLIGAPDADHAKEREAELEQMLGKIDEETLISDMTRCVQNCNLWKSMKSVKAPVENRGQRGFFIDYSVYNREPYSYSYEPDDKTKKEYQSKGLCDYCGSSFEASLIKKCRICGQRKDY